MSHIYIQMINTSHIYIYAMQQNKIEKNKEITQTTEKETFICMNKKYAKPVI